METRASIRHHPVHPMLVVFPIAFWIGSLVCDGMYHLGPHNLFWKDMAFYLMAGGVVGALAAAIPGFVDYIGLKDRRAKRIATTHMVLNLIVVALFLFNLGIRLNADPQTGTLDVVLSVLGIGILSVSGWLGGHLVYVGRIGVTERSLESDQFPRRAA
jgi:uncharacterized membrane protein